MMIGKPKLFARSWRSGALFIGLTVLYIFTSKVTEKIPANLAHDVELGKHLLLALMAIMGVHFLERAWLWQDIAEWNKHSLQEALQESERILNTAAACGLAMIYPTREAARHEVLKSINEAERRILLLGIGLSKKITLSGDLLGIIREKKQNEGFDIRILLLDGLRNTAVFRCFLESSADTVKEIIDTDRSDDKNPPPSDPYFNQTLYSDFVHAFKSLTNVAGLRESVRFYNQTPGCWLVIADNRFFFQPYSFGRPSNYSDGSRAIGHLMPVFEFRRETEALSAEILLDHFNKLWLSSNSDLFHMQARIADQDTIMHKIFKTRRSWFTHVYGVLFYPDKPYGTDRRKYPRKPCLSHIRLNVRNSQQKDKVVHAQADIHDFSREGIALILDDTKLSEGEPVVLEVATELEWRAAKDFKKELLDPSNSVFRVIHLQAKDSIVGFGSHPYSL